MDYTRITLFIRDEDAEPIAARLEAHGVSGVVLESPDLLRELLEKKNSYDWDYIDESVLAMEDAPASLAFYLEDTEENIGRLDEILDELQDFSLERVEVAGASDSDWVDNWKAYFKPAKVTDRIVVKPTWEEYEPTSPDEIVLEVDPGMAFGTGTHATTVLCLELMEEILGSEQGLSVGDIGCGSGILSIAAARLGAASVIGTEIDPVAVEVSRNNISVNDAEATVRIRQGDLASVLEKPVDLLVANLTADLVRRLAREAAPSLRPGGRLIASGLLDEQFPSVRNAIEEVGFHITSVRSRDGWSALCARMGGSE